MRPPAWRRRIGVLSIVVVAHWIAFGTLPVKPPHTGSVFSNRERAASLVSIRIGPAPAPTSAQARSRPVINKMLAQPNIPDARATENPKQQTPDQDSDGLYGVSGMLDDDRPIILIAPLPIQLQYGYRGEINGRAYASRGELRWQHDGKTYEARMDIVDLILGSRSQFSTGQLAERGLEPLQFEDKIRSDIATQFDQAAGKVHFAPPVADADLTQGAQDQLSIFIQIATIFASNADRLPQGSALAFQTIGARASERWVFAVQGSEMVMLPTGPVNTIHLTREPGGEQDVMLDLWLAPETGYLPLRIRVSNGSGGFVEQEWRATANP